MSYAIAAAGTGGHVFPALAVAEALIELGVESPSILFFGGHRFEADAVPAAGFELVGLELRGLKRSLSMENLGLPLVVRAAARRVEAEIRARGIEVLLATGGYVTVPAGWGARRAAIPFFVQEQNAEPGLANRIMSRWAQAAFSSFEGTGGLHREEFVGNPVRASIARFDRTALRGAALARYDLTPDLPTVGVVGGSLGAGAVNEAVAAMVERWTGPACQIVHLAGPSHAPGISARASTENPWGIAWRVVPFETHMEYFFAASDLVIARAGGMVAEITATGTPAILVPGEFGSAGHQLASAQALRAGGAAIIVSETDLGRLGQETAELLADRPRREAMRQASERMGRPTAARVIASRLVDAHG